MEAMNKELFVLAFLAACVAGCGIGVGTVWPKDWDAGTDAGEEDAGDAGDASSLTCEDRGGQCVPFPPLGWSDPILVATVPPGTPIECPAEAPQEHFRKYADLVAEPISCECACKPSTGSCTLPTTITAHSEACGVPGAIDTSFDPPADWDGTCTTSNSIPAGALCNGVPCVQSFTIGPMATVNESCEVDPIPVPQAGNEAPTWGSMVVACQGYPSGGEIGCGAGARCTPSPIPPPAFQVCVYKEGEVSCDGTNFTERFLIYSGFEDKRTCGPCGCSPEVTGSECGAFASIYTDGVCLDPLMPGVLISSVKEGCFDLTMPGKPLGGKAISGITYLPGACQPIGGEPQGEIEKLRPSTLCCVPKNDK
jgi:hypothetical protein